jgi:hypothetical protein
MILRNWIELRSVFFVITSFTSRGEENGLTSPITRISLQYCITLPVSALYFEWKEQNSRNVSVVMWKITNSINCKFEASVYEDIHDIVYVVYINRTPRQGLKIISSNSQIHLCAIIKFTDTKCGTTLSEILNLLVINNSVRKRTIIQITIMMNKVC